MKSIRKATRWIILGFLAGLLFFGWVFRVQMVLACAPYLERKGEEGGQWLRDRLIACGPSCIDPTIQTLRERSPWVRNYCYLPLVLGHFGEPARQRLLQAIDAEANDQTRAYLISSLQRGFHDFSRLSVWLHDYQKRKGAWGLAHMGSDVRTAFRDAPSLTEQDSKTLNPEFIKWWNAREAAR